MGMTEGYKVADMSLAEKGKEGLYVAGRKMPVTAGIIREEFEKTKDLHSAITRAITTAGKAVMFTATTMIAGVAFWTMSFLRFQADMGLLLVFWMVISMLGGLILLPTLIYLIKPRFIIGKKA